MTAVEWLQEKFNENNAKFINWSEDYFNEAKEMEKQQIIDAHGNKQKKSGCVSNYTYILTGEEYYKKEYER
jgi:hypothetical protein